MTLPAIMAMERYPEGNPIPMIFQHPDDETHLKRAVDMIQSSSITQDAYSVAKEFCDKALKALRTLPPKPQPRLPGRAGGLRAEKTRVEPTSWHLTLPHDPAPDHGQPRLYVPYPLGFHAGRVLVQQHQIGQLARLYGALILFLKRGVCAPQRVHP